MGERLGAASEANRKRITGRQHRSDTACRRIRCCVARCGSRQPRAPVPVAVAEKLHRKSFSNIAAAVSQLSRILRAYPVHRAREMQTNTTVEWGGAMRNYSDMEMPDTAPYKEWLGIVGSMVVAALVGVVLFSGGILT
jgi:hypothetical protein